MLSSTTDGCDLHTLTMDTYRARIWAVLGTAVEEIPDADLVEELARLTDMAAAERVLDEAAIRELPDPEHPAVADLRSRLRHAEALIGHLVTVPAKRAANMLRDETLGESEREAVARLANTIHEGMRLPSRSGCGESFTSGAADALFHAIRMIRRRLAVAQADPHTRDETIMSLKHIEAELLTMRGSLFRDAAYLAIMDEPEVDLGHVAPWADELVSGQEVVVEDDTRELDL